MTDEDRPDDGPADAGTEGDPAVDSGAEGPSGLRILLEAGRPQLNRGQLVVALLCGLLGFALVTQVHSTSTARFATARQSDLVDILDSLSSKSDQLRAQIATEQNSLSKLTGGTDQNQAALTAAQQRAATLEILAGTAAATGPGIELKISDPQHQVNAEELLEIVEELRDAGAEAIQISGTTPQASSVPNSSVPASPGQVAPAGTSAVSSAGPASAVASPVAGDGAKHAVRLVASSYFVDTSDNAAVVIDGVTLTGPFDLLAIGDPPTLNTAMGIPGGVLDTITLKGGTGTVIEHSTLDVTALHEVGTPQYAHPAPSATSGG
jgi:uncharacterized protein YlxW (UPF0749 family)